MLPQRVVNTSVFIQSLSLLQWEAYILGREYGWFLSCLLRCSFGVLGRELKGGMKDERIWVRRALIWLALSLSLCLRKHLELILPRVLLWINQRTQLHPPALWTIPVQFH